MLNLFNCGYSIKANTTGFHPVDTDSSSVTCSTIKGQNMDAFSRHEVLDRLHLSIVFIEDFLLHHPFVSDRDDLVKFIEGASDLLGEAYQIVGAENFDRG